MVTETDKAYIAGFVDGEGCFSISRAKGRRSPSHQPSIVVANTNRPVLEFLKEHYGGWVVQTHRASREPGHSDCWAWRCATGSMRRFIEDIAPYLRIKNEQAESLLDLIESKERSKQKYRGAHNPLPETEIVYRDQLQQRLNQLNFNRGPVRKKRRKEQTVKPEKITRHDENEIQLPF